MTKPIKKIINFEKMNMKILCILIFLEWKKNYLKNYFFNVSLKDEFHIWCMISKKILTIYYLRYTKAIAVIAAMQILFT